MPDTCHYNFVPLPPHIVEPEWQDRVSHDLPLQDGLCVEIDVELEAHTPLLVGGRREVQVLKGQPDVQVVHFFTLPDGTKAIPGSSVRGMVRGVLELASFSRIRMVHDRQLAARDVGNRVFRDYGSRFVAQTNRPPNAGGGRRPYASRVLTGWLRFDGHGWKVHPCQHERVEHRVLNLGLRFDLLQGINGANDADRMAQWKYERLLSKAPDLRLFAGKIDRHHVDDGNIRRVSLLYARCGAVSKKPDTVCTQERRLVVTGQVNNGKHREFLFDVNTGAAIDVPPEVWRAFLDINETAGRGDESTYQWLKRKQPFGTLGMPVFYLPDARGGVQHMGLCQMFKLPYPRTLHGYMGVHGQPAPAPRQRDFVETLFGTDVWPDAAAQAAGGLKSRVSFGDLVAIEAPAEAPSPFQAPTVLATPKPTFHPTYFSGLPELKPLPEGQVPAQQISGVKRYPAQVAKDVNGVPSAQPGQERVASCLRPVAAGSRFKGRIRLHNVLPQELGAILWVLLWGGEEKLRHALGMARPFGLGQVSLKVTGMSLRSNDPATSAAEDVNEYMRSFSDYMEGQYNGWRNTPTLRELMAMAKPGTVPAVKLKPMKFHMDANSDEFRGALANHWRLQRHTERAGGARE